MKRSLRMQLTVSVVAVLAGMLVVFALLLHSVVRRALTDQFDARLLGDATAIGGMAEDERPAPPMFEYQSLPEFERAFRPAYFQAWLDDGHVLAHSPSLSFGNLPLLGPPASTPRFAGVVLPDGRSGRAVQLSQPLRMETLLTARWGAAIPPPQSTRLVTVVVARGTEELVATLARVRNWLVVLSLVAIAVASLAAAAAVSRSLRSTRALADAIGARDVGDLDRAIAVRGLPGEIVPVVEKLNEMLSRVRESFEREKRFTADVSHELRTPLAALRTTLEVTLSRPRTQPEYRAAMEEAHLVVRQMHALCDNLLALARLDAGQIRVRDELVGLRALVDDCWRPLAARAGERRLRFDNDVDAASEVRSDPDHLLLIVSNLLSNAVSYTAEGGTVQAAGPAPGVLLEVHDSGPPIAADVLPQIFDRFFCGDPARADGFHCGIGLALARGVASTLGLDISARNTPDGGVAFRVSRRIRIVSNGMSEN